MSAFDGGLKMYHDCVNDECTQRAYMFPLSVTQYVDQTCVGMVILCPACYTRAMIDYGLESSEGILLDKRPMSDDEVKLVHELDAL